MIFADKLIQLRKKEGWSQEDLAAKLNVSRQSVSKWESAGSVPDLDKIMKLSEIFGVSTDYLLKDSLGEEIEYSDTYDESASHKISVEEANDYMNLVKRLSPIRAIFIALYVLSPLGLILLSIFADAGVIGITPEQASAIGLVLLFLTIAISTSYMIISGRKLEPFEEQMKEDFVLEYGVQGIVEEKLKAFENRYTYCTTAGVFLCICAVVPLILIGCFNGSDLSCAFGLGFLFCSVAIAVYLFTSVGSIRSAYQQLLQKEDYTPSRKEANRRSEPISRIYWLVVVAGFLGYSFVTGDWSRSWIIWPVAGVLFGVIATITELLRKDKN